MSVNLNKLDSMLDETLNKETTESLNEWIDTKEPLFTLTAEEIDYLKQLLEEEVSDLYQTQILYSNTHIWLVKINKANNLLTRIKQWQNENQ